MTIVLPASFLALAYYNVKTSSIGIYGAGVYIFLATVWILFCIPHYASEDNIEKNKESLIYMKKELTNKKMWESKWGNYDQLPII